MGNDHWPGKQRTGGAWVQDSESRHQCLGGAVRKRSAKDRETQKEQKPGNYSKGKEDGDVNCGSKHPGMCHCFSLKLGMVTHADSSILGWVEERGLLHI